jgi:hypothetical protein
MRLHGVVQNYLTTLAVLPFIFTMRLSYTSLILCIRQPLWSSGQTAWLQIQRSRVRFPALPEFLRSSGSGMESTQPREYN